MTLTKTDRERVIHAAGRRGLASPPSLGHRPPYGGLGPQQNPRRRMASRNTNIALPNPRPACRQRLEQRCYLNPIRLSATDISALASMKNVAKCDTWCELQNPANHRVFERKLRPRPSGRGHVCLGVTPKDTPHPSRCGRGIWLPVPNGAVGRSWGCRLMVPVTAQGG